MNAAFSLAALLDAKTLAMVDRLAQARGVTDIEFAVEAIRRVAESESDYRAFIQVGIDAADRGEVIAHEDVMAELDAMIAAHRAR